MIFGRDIVFCCPRCGSENHSNLCASGGCMSKREVSMIPLAQLHILNCLCWRDKPPAMGQPDGGEDIGCLMLRKRIRRLEYTDEAQDMSANKEIAFVWRLAEYFANQRNCNNDGGGLGEPCLCARCSLARTFRRYADETEKAGGISPVAACHTFKRRDDNDKDLCAKCSLDIRSGIHIRVKT